MIAIVTDKPNVGREIARVLGADRKENGYMSGNGYMVSKHSINSPFHSKNVILLL